MNKMTHKEYVTMQKKAALDTAYNIINEKINIIAGCSFLYSIWSQVDLPENCEEYGFIAHLDDEYEEMRDMEPDKINEVINFYRKEIMKVCKKIIWYLEHEKKILKILDKKPNGYTWHHHQDGKTMQLVPTDVHRAVGHTGGVKIVKK